MPDEDPKNKKKKHSNEKNKLLTRKELSDMKEKHGRLDEFLNLFDNFVDNVNRSASFEDTYNIITNFVITCRRSFGRGDKQINSIIDQLTYTAESSRKDMDQVSKEISNLIQEMIKLYNAEFHGDLVFDGDITKWLKRTFPLIRLYVKKNKLQ